MDLRLTWDLLRIEARHFGSANQLTQLELNGVVGGGHCFEKAGLNINCLAVFDGLKRPADLL